MKFIQLWNKCLFSRETTFDKDITPYIHVFVYHAQYFAQRYGSLKAFEMEAVEQLNYVNKLVFFGASNKGKENFTVTEQVWENNFALTNFFLDTNSDTVNRSYHLFSFTQIMCHSTRGVVAVVENLKRIKIHYASRKW